ncbi:TetR family transcriptional regulator C-terminal domain-containing protein [Streptomyces sp. NPDC102451]|uniref:TetR family transcriptional regulator C-terminal domain-containing protein n=1 Tax=Streptomyces sp. NPDC102451 TaxID=3366177 RepID=UPI0038303B6C
MDNSNEPHLAHKTHLPHPYNQDLSHVLRHLSRITATGRKKLANSLSTAGYLAAGMRLIQQHLGPEAVRSAAAGNTHALERPLLGFLSQRAVAAAVAENPPPFTHRGGVPRLRTTWRSQSDFVADLINFAMWPANYHPGYLEQRAVVARGLAAGEDFVRAVHETAYRHTAESARMPSVRLSLALMVLADGDDAVQRALAETYRGYLSSWKQVYAEVLQARNLRLRPGLDLDDLANALSAATDGMVLRSIGDPQSQVVDQVRERSLMGTVALAVMHGFLEPADSPDGLTLEEAVAARLGRSAS